MIFIQELYNNVCIHFQKNPFCKIQTSIIINIFDVSCVFLVLVSFFKKTNIDNNGGN